MVVETKYGALLLQLSTSNKDMANVTIGGEEVTTTLPLTELVAMVRVLVAGAQT